MPAYYLEVTVVVLGLALLLADAFVEGPDKRWIGTAGMLGLAGVFALNFFARGGQGGFWDYYTYGPGSFAGFYKGLAILSAILFLLMSRDYLPVLRQGTAEGHAAGEFFALPLFACAGMMWAASAVDLVSIFVSIELITVSFYVLAGYMRRAPASLEAGVKYLILSALATCFLVYGIAWTMGTTGTTNLEELAARTAQASPGARPGLLFGFALLLVGLGFKVGAFPFCLWIPDVYQGAPTPATALLTTGSKAAGFIVLMRVLEPFLQAAVLSNQVAAVLTLVSVATLLFGSLVAMLQSNFKRLLAYSSIAQAGFMLLAVSCSPLVRSSAPLSPAAVVSFYLASYLMMAGLAFYIVVLVQRHAGGEDLKSYQGLGRRSPFLAFALLASMMSLAGIPLTAGFFGKFFVFQLAVAAGAWWPLGIAAVAAACGFYYYLKVVRAMYFAEPEPGSGGVIRLPPITKVVLTVLVFGIFAFGVNPRPLLDRAPASAPKTAVVAECPAPGSPELGKAQATSGVP